MPLATAVLADEQQCRNAAVRPVALATQGIGRQKGCGCPCVEIIGSTHDNLTTYNGHVVNLPPPFIIYWRSPIYFGEGACSVIASCSCAIGSTITNSGWCANAPNLVVALVDTTILRHPVLPTRFHLTRVAQIGRWSHSQCTCWQSLTGQPC
jgi:hypothetical protein